MPEGHPWLEAVLMVPCCQCSCTCGLPSPCPAGYVRLVNFSGHAAHDMQRAIWQLKVCKVASPMLHVRICGLTCRLPACLGHRLHSSPGALCCAPSHVTMFARPSTCPTLLPAA